jgi:hypothetical protein
MYRFLLILMYKAFHNVLLDPTSTACYKILAGAGAGRHQLQLKVLEVEIVDLKKMKTYK